MRTGNASEPEPTVFSAVITPHRSLSRAGFIALMAAIGGVSFAAGMVFFIAGAWPVAGFFGLDVLLIYWALKVNYWRAAAYEEVIVTPGSLVVRNVSHRGHSHEWSANPRWVKLDREQSDEFGLERLFLVSHGRRVPVAGFLGPAEKEGFARALSDALERVRRGWPHTPVTTA